MTRQYISNRQERKEAAIVSILEYFSKLSRSEIALTDRGNINICGMQKGKMCAESIVKTMVNFEKISLGDYFSLCREGIRVQVVYILEEFPLNIDIRAYIDALKEKAQVALHVEEGSPGSTRRDVGSSIRSRLGHPLSKGKVEGIELIEDLIISSGAIKLVQTKPILAKGLFTFIFQLANQESGATRKMPGLESTNPSLATFCKDTVRKIEDNAKLLHEHQKHPEIIALAIFDLNNSQNTTATK